MNKQTKHQFALYCDQLAISGTTITITDPELVQRTFKILRLEAGDHLQLFNGIQVVDITITTLDKKQLVGTILSSEIMSKLKPEIQCFVPVLKRDALEDVIYSAVELGATSIQLIFTEKIHRVWAGDKEFARLHGIMIAACEQAKQFMVPELHQPIPFDQMLPQLGGTVIFFDADGKPLYDVITALRTQNLATISLLIGPEADLTPQEKDQLGKKSVIFCKLTPTVLRARQAFALGLGAIRSVIR